MRANDELLKAMYAAFNRRDVEAVFSAMREDVDWPNAMEGTMIRGKDAIRAYWLHQWSVVDPHVEPVEMSEQEDGCVRVRVHQVVRALDGAVISDGTVDHVYRIVDGLIARMDVEDGEAGNRFTAKGQGSGSGAEGVA